MIHDNNETPEIEDVMMRAISDALGNTHTALIAKITKINQGTINCKPVTSRVVNNNKIDLPEFAEVPVAHLFGGVSSVRMPISVGDYCLLIIMERCFDNWYEGHDFLEPVEKRKHDYSDAIAFVGVKNKKSELPIPSRIEILGDVYKKGKHTHDGSYNLNGNMDATTYSAGGASGASGTFTTVDGKTVTVTNGIVTSIV